MSFYLGSDNNGNKIMHMTKGQHELETMKGDSFDDTVFHSSLGYMRVKGFGIDRKVIGREYTRDGWTFTVNYIVVTDEFLEYYGDDKKAFFIEIDGEIQTGVSFNNVIRNLCFDESDYIGTAGAYPSNIKKAISCPINENSNVRVLVMNVNPEGFVPLDTSGDIIIGNNTLTVGSVDILDFNYITTKKLNYQDKKLRALITSYDIDTLNYSSTDTASSVYLIEASESDGFLSMNSKEIKKGNMTLFSSLYSASRIMYKSRHVKYASTIDSSKKNLFCDESFNDGDMFMIMNVWNESYESPFFMPLRFINGKMCDIAYFLNYNQVLGSYAYLEGINNKIYLSFTSDIGTSTPSMKSIILKFTN